MKLNVLVVDDETPICEWLVYILRKASDNYAVSAASNGEEAYRKILEQKPDLVLTDIRMPGMDGLELMRRTLEVLPFTAFAILTNYAEFGYAKQALSLGAREYFLKSELRSKDLEALLEQVLASKIRTRGQKVDDVFRSGCIDLYNFYKNQQEPGHADRFWEKQGMWKSVPYRVLCLTAGGRPEEWQEVAAAARKVGADRSGSAYLAAASEKGYDYVIVQTESGLQECVQALSRALIHRGCLGLSSVLWDRKDIAWGLREAASAKMGEFFDTHSPLIFFDGIQDRRPLDRNRIQESREEVLSRIHQWSYGEAKELLMAWFDQLMEPAAGDMKWAVDTCRRMVLSVEEQYHQENKESPVEMVIPQSALDCRNRCLDMVDAMEHSHSARHSPSIAAAMAYIHAHYQENISMAEVARQIYRSPEYFSRQFKEEVGETFSAYLTLYRLNKAQELLDRTDLRIAEIAERVGYVTPGYFSRIYKKYRGITPEQSRMSKK